MIKIDFSFDTQYGVYRDALHLDDNHSFTEQVEEIIEEPTEEFLEEVDNG